jgi:predicted acetyltransferase
MGAHGASEDWTREEAADPVEFGRLVAAVRREADPKTVDGDEWLGRLSIRHALTPALLELGGHIGYMVRPSARRKGYATQMLTQSLPIAAGLGIDPALVTCDNDNDASRKVIQAAGGEFDDERHGKLRYWVPTHVS